MSLNFNSIQQGNCREGVIYMSIERIRLSGLQSRSLELGRKKRDKTTPTTEGDIGQRARLYKGLAEGAAVAHMALEGMSDGRGTPEMVEAQTSTIRAARREAVMAGFNLSGFDLVVQDRIAIIKAKAEEDRLAEEVTQVIVNKKGALSPDWEIINAELPGDFQPTLGDVPPRNDAGGFEPVKRGW